MVKPTGRHERLSGTVKRLVFDRGFGFIRDNDTGSDFFFHRSSCERVFGELTEGQAVTFLVGESRKGPRAEAIELKD